MWIVLHLLEANVHAECSTAIRTKEPLNIALLVVSDAELPEIGRLTEDTGIDLDGLNN
jgi:hypothetical protein